MADQYYQQVIEKEKDFSDLWNRMDEDKKLLVLEDFIMRDKDNREEPDVDNITMNDAGVFAQKVHNTLIKADVQPEVEGEGLKDEYTSMIEAFIRDIGLEADSFANNRDIPSFKEWEVMQACDRGRVARRIYLREEDGKLTPDSFKEIDSRYLIYDVGMNGLNWAAVKTNRTQADIKDEYGHETTKKTAIVTDFWDKDMERVYVGRELVKEEENFYKEVPFVIQVIPSGLLVMDDDRILRSGESIFSLNRDLFDKKNTFATILNSLTQRAFFNGLQLEVEDVARAKKPNQPPYGKKFVVPVEKGTRGYFEMPIQDLQRTAQLFYQILDSALQDGAFPKISYGTLQFPISAVGMAELKEAEDPVYFPRLQGLSLFWQRVYRMVIKQYTQLKLNIELGEPGFKQQYSYKDLSKDYSIKFRFYVSSPKQDMVNISTAAAVGDLVSDDTKRRDYLHIQNPTEEDNKLWAEKAAKVSPAVAKYDIIKALIARDEKIKAKLMAAEMGLDIDNILNGVVPGAEQPEPQKPKQLMPMFQGQGGNIQTNVKATSPVAGEEE